MGSENEMKEVTRDASAPLNIGDDVKSKSKSKPKRKRKARPNNRNRQRRLVKWIAERFPASFDEPHPTVAVEAKRDTDAAERSDPDVQRSDPDLSRADTDTVRREPELVRREAKRDTDAVQNELDCSRTDSDAANQMQSDPDRSLADNDAERSEPELVRRDAGDPERRITNGTDDTHTDSDLSRSDKSTLQSNTDLLHGDKDAVQRDLDYSHGDKVAGQSDPGRSHSDADSSHPGTDSDPDSSHADTDPVRSDSDTGSSRGHILEIAGGQGELAVRLAMFYHRRVVMIDPRAVDIARTFETQVCPRLPLNRQQQWKDTLEREDASFLRDRVREKISHIAAYFTEEAVENDARVREAVRDASLIVALHPDKPTEAIVDAALKFRKPFVVIPCCVFPNFFQRRMVVMEDGQPPVRVRSYEQLCRYLVKKHAGFRMETLPFEGRNVAIWWDGVTDTAAPQPDNEGATA